MPRPRVRGFVGDARDLLDGRVGVRSCLRDVSEMAVVEQFPCRLNERGERAVGILCEKGVGWKRLVLPWSLQLLNEVMQSVWSDYVYTVTCARIAMCMRRDNDRVHLPVRAMPVVAAQVTRIPGGLVEIGLIRFCLAFEFEDDDRSTHEQDDIGTPGFKRQLVLENGRIPVREVVHLDNPADLALQLRNRVLPGENLGLAHIREKLFEGDAHDPRLFFRERGEVALPATPGASTFFSGRHV